MIIYENTLEQFKKDIRRKKLVNFICAEYESAAKTPVSGEIRYAWKYTFRNVFSMLETMGSKADPEAGVRIDLEEGTQFRQMKLIFASRDSSGFHYSLLGLFAGSTVSLTKADDIVSFREGSLQWTSVHPSMFMNSFARRLLRGVPEEEAGSVVYECASWLFDCFYSCDSDIITDYKKPLTDEFPVFYANDTEDLVHFLLPVLRVGNGLEALRKLGSVEALSAAKSTVDRNEDQIYLISSITNAVLRGRKAWYIIEGQTGTGKGEIVRGVSERLANAGKTVGYLKEDELPESWPDLLVIDQRDGFSFEDLEFADVSIFLCDQLRDPNFESFAEDARLAAQAKEKGIQLYISHLKQAVSFSDGGKGARWLINRLQLAEIPREDYDPDTYTIKVVKTKEDLDKGGSDMASVVLQPNVTYDPETGIISIKKAQKKGIYNALSGGRNGILIFCSDQNLKTYLEKEISALRSRQAWLRNYVGKLSEGKKESEEKMDSLQKESAEKIRAADEGYSKKIRSSIGKGAWNKLSEESRMWLISAMMVYDHLKSVNRAIDFSGVCVQVGKACEYELRRRIYTAYLEYEISLYGERGALDRLPPECKTNDGNSQSEKFLPEDKITMGKLRYIMGLYDGGRIVDSSFWEEFRAFAEEKLLVRPANSVRILRSQLPVITKIKDDYRNRSAHAESISIVDARECIEYVITMSRKLGILLDEYRF